MFVSTAAKSIPFWLSTIALSPTRAANRRGTSLSQAAGLILSASASALQVIDPL